MPFRCNADRRVQLKSTHRAEMRVIHDLSHDDQYLDSPSDHPVKNDRQGGMPRDPPSLACGRGHKFSPAFQRRLRSATALRR